MSGSRERKRAERRQRRMRAAERQAAMAQRSEAKNEAVRETLEPLAEGERPTPVTIAVWLSALLAMIFTVSTVMAAAGVEVQGKQPSPIPLAIFAAAIWWMTWGLWRARYWAVLGFQMLLLLLMLSAAAALVGGNSIPQTIGSLLLLAGTAWLFFKMIRAMARIQMPARPG
jgi:cation transport ATPase